MKGKDFIWTNEDILRVSPMYIASKAGIGYFGFEEPSVFQESYRLEENILWPVLDND